METKEQLEQELELLKNKKRVVELKLLCFEKGTTFSELCTNLKFKTERLTKQLMTKEIGIQTIFKIQRILNLDSIPEMFFID